jgi:hypothetical protein
MYNDLMLKVLGPSHKEGLITVKQQVSSFHQAKLLSTPVLIVLTGSNKGEGSLSCLRHIIANMKWSCQHDGEVPVMGFTFVLSFSCYDRCVSCWGFTLLQYVHFYCSVLRRT